MPRKYSGQLTILNGPQENQIIPLFLDTLTIGRDVRHANWEISLRDLSVSRPHARMELVDGGWLLCDLNSANGTFINGERIDRQGRSLEDGDIITIGTIDLLYHTRSIFDSD